MYHEHLFIRSFFSIDKISFFTTTTNTSVRVNKTYANCWTLRFFLFHILFTQLCVFARTINLIKIMHAYACFLCVFSIDMSLSLVKRMFKQRQVIKCASFCYALSLAHFHIALCSYRFRMVDKTVTQLSSALSKTYRINIYTHNKDKWLCGTEKCQRNSN